MSHRSYRALKNGYASHFPRTDSVVYDDRLIDDEVVKRFSPDCTWADCRHPRFYDMPVCQAHAIMVYDRVRSAHEGTKAKPELGESFDLPQRLEIKFYVYYLRVGPSTVKIGYSRDLQSRMVGLRAELRSVMALEVGGRELERQRHMQFAEERDGRREDFELSDRLQAHIDSLAPKRMKLMTDAVRKRNRSIYQ